MEAKRKAGRPSKQESAPADTEAGIEVYDAAENNIEVPDKPARIERRPDDDGQLGEPIADPREEIYAKYVERQRAESAEKNSHEQPVRQDAPKIENGDEVTIMVNGKERKVPSSKVEDAGGVANYQKMLAANDALMRAREQERNVQAESNRLKLFEQQLLNEQKNFAATQRNEAPPTTDALKKLAEEYSESLLNGDVEIAANILLQIQGAHKATPIDVEAIAEKAVRRARAELDADRRLKTESDYKFEQDEASVRFMEENKDIVSDPELFDMTQAKTLTIQAEHPEWGPARIIEEATKRVRTWVSKFSSPSVDKLTAKRSQDVVRGGSARQVSRQAPPAQTGSDYITSLRKQRGLE